MHTHKHTPGPWQVQPLASSHGADMAICTPSNGWVVAVIENDPDIQTVDEPNYDTVVWHDADLANARLIAAAPELLGALVSIMEHVQFTSAWEDAVNGNDDAMLSAGQNAYAAIAKATGETA